MGRRRGTRAAHVRVEAWGIGWMSYASQAAASGGTAGQPRIWLAVTDPSGVPRGGGAIGAEGAWIGRSAGAEIRIEDAARAVSSQHARIEREGDGFVVIDQSLNGTALNAERLVKGQRRGIAVGDMLLLCGWRVAVLADDPAAARPAAALPAAAPGAASTAPSPPKLAPSPVPTPLAAPGAASPVPSAMTAAASPVPPAMTTADGTIAALPRFGTAPAPARPRLDLTLADLVGPAAPPPPAAPPAVLPAAFDHLDDLLPVAPAASPAPPIRHAAPPAAPPAAAPAPTADLLAAFWRGLGLAPARATPALMEELGRALHEAWIEAGRAAAPPAEDAPVPPARAGLRGLRAALDAPDQPHFAEALRTALAEPGRREAVLRDAVDQAAARMAESLSARALESRLAATVRTTWSWRRRGELWRHFEALEQELREAAEGRFRKDLNERLRGETRLLTWAGPKAP